MALESTKSPRLKRMEEQLEELQQSLSEDVPAFRDTSVEAAQSRRQKTAHENGATIQDFGETYLPHYFTSDPAPFHRDLDQMVVSADRHVYIVHGPREHAKSTIVRCGLIREVLNGRRHYPLVISEDLKISEAHLAYIGAELTNNRRIQADYDVEVQRFTAGVLQVRVTPRATGLASTARLEASSHKRGVKGSLFRQHRPDFALIDDFEDRESARSTSIAEKKTDWVFQELYPACAGGPDATDGDENGAPIIWLGNTTAQSSALYQAMLETVDDTTGFGEPEDALRDFLRGGTDPRGSTNIPTRPDRAVEAARNGLETGVWEADESELPPETQNPEPSSDSGRGSEKVTAAKSIYCYRASTQIEGGENAGETVYLWPQRYKASWYLQMKMTMGPRRYEAEMNGNPIVVGVFFDADWFPTYDELPDAADRGYMWTDPAFGESTSAAYKAVVAIATDAHRYFVLDAWLRQQEGIRAMIWAMYVLYERWDVVRHGGFEENFRQDDRLERDLSDVAAEHGYPLPVSAHPNTANKEARIESMEPLASNGRILWPSKARRASVNWKDVERLKSQMLSWPKGSADDGPDALESAISRLRLGRSAGDFEYESIDTRRYSRR